MIACDIACNSRIASYRGLDLPADFGAAGAQDNTRGFSTLRTLLSGVAGCGRSALLVRIDLDVRTVRIECHFNDVARGLCLWSGQLRLVRRETEGPSGERPCRVSAIPSERHLFGIISELRRLNRSIALPLERDLKRAGCPPLERYEVLREIGESGDVHLSPVELQTRLAVPRDRMLRLIDRLAKDGYIERERVASDGSEHFVVITDSGRRASKHASLVLSAALRQFFYSSSIRRKRE